MFGQKQIASVRIRRKAALSALFEPLENRQLMAAQPLPINLTFGNVGAGHAGSILPVWGPVSPAREANKTRHRLPAVAVEIWGRTS